MILQNVEIRSYLSYNRKATALTNRSKYATYLLINKKR